MLDDTQVHSLLLTSIPHSTRTLLSRLLNPAKIIPNDEPDRLPRDWRGLACRANISAELECYIQQCSDKTARVLQIWQQASPTATVGDLLGHLEYIDRYDVYDDVCNDLKEAIRSNEISGGSRPHNTAAQTNNNSASTKGYSELITYDDRLGYAHIYDALVLYADEDREFVSEMLRRLAAEGLHICTIDDIQVGHTTQFSAVARLIAERCRRIILVFSPEFLNSSCMTFYMNFTQAHVIETKERKILPIMYRPCILPPHVSYYHKLFYHSEGRPMYDFWYKLKQSLEASRVSNAVATQQPPARINGSAAINNPPQIAIEYIDDELFLPRNDHSISMSALDTLKISSIATTEDCHSLSNISQMSRTSEIKKKNPVSKLFKRLRRILPSKSGEEKTKTKAILVAD